MTDQPAFTGIKVSGTELSEEETAAVLTVVNTQLINAPQADRTVDHATRKRVTSTWAPVNSWHNLPPGH